MKLKIGVLDYGIGNLSSIKNTLSIRFQVNLKLNYSELKKAT